MDYLAGNVQLVIAIFGILIDCYKPKTTKSVLQGDLLI